MPITLEVDAARGRLRTAVEGPVTVAEAASHLETLVARHLEGFPELIDASRARGPGWFSVDVRRAADLVVAAKGAARFAPRAVVVSTSAAFGMVRMFSVLIGSRLRLEVFRDAESAERWLDGASGAAGTLETTVT